MKEERYDDEYKAKLGRHNPFVDVAAYLFLEDIGDKQGAAGMNNYLMSLATSLAKSMPKEEYSSWDDFMDSLLKGESIISSFEDVHCPTENCVVTETCPFTEGWQEYTKRIGEFADIHKEVAEYYNSTVKPGAVDSQCIIHQTFRKAAAERIKVAGKPVKYAQIEAVTPNADEKRAPNEWLPILLNKANITETELNMTMRNNDCVWILYTE